MTNCLCIGDQHFTKHNKNLTDLLLIRAVEQIEERRPDFVVLLGDIGDQHNIAEIECYDRIISFLSSLDDACKRINASLFLLIGNHDRKNNRDFMTDTHFFNSVKKWNSIVVVDSTTERTINNKKFCFIPYVPDGKLNTALGTLDPLSYSAIFCHQTLSLYSSVGDKIPKEWKCVISGHIHDYMHEGNVWYVGTPYPVTFAEETEKSISFFTFTDEGEAEEERIFLKIGRKITHTIDFKDLDTYKQEEDNTGMVVGYRVKVLLSPDQTDILRHDSKYCELIKAGIKVVPVYQNKVKAEKLKINSYISTLRSILTEDEDIMLSKILDL